MAIESPKPTEVQRRILADFADTNLRTRHSRTSIKDWNENRQAMIAAGWIAIGSASYGGAHYITEAGCKALTSEAAK